MKLPRVAVCMPAFNAEEYIHRSVTSILEQTFEDYHLYICDDASTDNTLRELESFSDPRIRVIRNSKNNGPAATRNKITSIVLDQGYEYMALMDSDDISYPSRLEIQTTLMDNNQAISFCGSSADVEKNGGVWRVSKTPAQLKRDCIFANPFPTPTLMFRTVDLKKTAAQYREKMVPCADYDLMRYLLIECKMMAEGIVEPLLLYTYNPKGVSHSDARQKQIKMDILVKEKILKHFCISVPNDWLTSFHDVAFHQPDATSEDVLRFMVISQLIIDRNNQTREIAAKHLLSSIRNRVSWHRDNSRHTQTSECNLNPTEINSQSYNSKDYLYRSFVNFIGN